MRRNAGVIGRRAVLWAGAGLVARPATAALPVPQAGSLAFSMVRHGSEIGRHILTFERRGETLTIRVAVDARVTFLSIPLARYRHHVVETWLGGTLMSLVGETDRNGRREWIDAHRTEAGLVVTGSNTARYTAPDDALATTYWIRRLMGGPMIDAENGELMHPKVSLDRAETIRLASGGTIVADHYNLSGDCDADVWYDRTDTRASLAFDVDDGSNIHYERL